MYCSLSAGESTVWVEAPVARRTGSGGGFSDSPVFLTMLVDVLVREGGGGGTGRGFVRIVVVDAEETDLLSPFPGPEVLVGGMFFNVIKPSPVFVEVSVDGLVGFGGGRFCELGLDEVDDTDEANVDAVDAWRSPSAFVGGCDSGVPLRGAGGGGAVFAGA
jgi:hypothetical protein